MPLRRTLPFTIIESEFQGLHGASNALTIDGALISASLPPRRLAPHELRAVLLQRSTAHETQDADRVRADDPTWSEGRLARGLCGPPF
jgi:hypothetical protein